MSFPNPDTLFRQLLPYFLSRDEFSQIAQTTLTGSVASVTFSSIPQTFRTLLFVIQARVDRVAESDTILIRLNGDAGTNYDSMIFSLISNNTTAAASTLASATAFVGTAEASNSRASNFANNVIVIPNYTSTNRDKHATNWGGVFGNASVNTDLFYRLIQSRWRNNNAITTVRFAPNIGPNFVSGCIFQLYGLQ